MSRGPNWSAEELAAAQRMQAAGMTQREIARIMGRSKSGVENRLQKLYEREPGCGQASRESGRNFVRDALALANAGRLPLELPKAHNIPATDAEKLFVRTVF